MKPLALTCHDGGGIRTLSLSAGSRHLIGAARRCDLRLSGNRVGRRHAELRVDEDGAHIRVLGNRLTMTVNAEPARQAGPLAPGDEISIGDALLQVNAAEGRNSNTEFTELPASQAVSDPPCTHPALAAEIQPAPVSPALVRRFQEAISERLDLYRRDILQSLSTERLREEATATAWALIDAGELDLPAEAPAETVVAAVVAETVGLGPIERLMEDPAVSEIMVNGHEQIYVERHGQLEKTGLRFSSAASLARRS